MSVRDNRSYRRTGKKSKADAFEYEAYQVDGSQLERDAFSLSSLRLDYVLRTRRGLRSTTDTC